MTIFLVGKFLRGQENVVVNSLSQDHKKRTSKFATSVVGKYMELAQSLVSLRAYFLPVDKRNPQ